MTSAAYAVVGAAMILVYRGADKALDDFCDGELSPHQIGMHSLITQIEDFVKPHINEFMCSVDCACNISDNLPESAVT